MPSKDRVYRVNIPKGTHLARSKNTEGAFRSAVLDDETNQVSGQAELFEVDRDEDDETEAFGDSHASVDAVKYFAAGAFSTAAAGLALVVANPMFKKLWHEKCLPSLQARLHSLRHRKESKRLELALQSPELRQMNPETMAIEVFRAAKEPQLVMASEEAQARYIAMVFYFAKAAKHCRELKSARIDIANDQQELQDALNCIASESVVSLANRVLEADDGLAREANLWLHAFLEDNASNGAPLIPLKITQVRAMMQLSS